MSPGPYLDLVALLYYLCAGVLSGLSLSVVAAGSRHSRIWPWLRRIFYLLVVSLLTWQATLFLEVRSASATVQLWLGRTNFAAVVFTATFALLFVERMVSPADAVRRSRYLLLGETLGLGILTVATPLVSMDERVVAGRAITAYGPLFPLYLLHVVGCLLAAVVVALRARQRADDRQARRQLALVGYGMLLTGAVGVVTNVVLPYGTDDFRWCDIGPLSTLLFSLAVAWATFVYRLFNLRIIVRETLVHGLLLAFVLGAYSSAVFVISQYLTGSAEKLTQFAVLLIAFSFDPLRRFLEKKTDELLFERGKTGSATKPEAPGRRASPGTRLTLALLFPWRR